jgi:hypothetical protein
MRTKTDITLACASFTLGALLSIRLMRTLFGGQIYMDERLAFLAPGWYLLRGIRDSIVVTVFETVVFGGIIYFAARVMAWLLSAPRARYR